MDFPTDLFLEYKKRPGRAALARLLERHQDAVYTLCHQVLRHPQDAEDACQEVLLEVSRQVDSVEEPGKFSAWLYRTAIHTALDVRRKRGRQRARDAGASRAPGAEPQPPEATEALHQGLAGLDDTSRTLVVEHYFARRPLRELAAERGCSEVAVWKRIQNAKERLRKSLGSAAVLALDGMAKVSAPAGLLQKALGLSGGLAMAIKVGIKVAIVVPLLLLAGAGTVAYVRRPDPPPPPRAEVRKSTPSRPASVKGHTPVAVALVAPIPIQPAARIRKPYPFKDRSADWPPAAVRTWSILSSKKLTLDHSNISLAELLKDFSELTGISVAHAPGFDQEFISIKVEEIIADGCLRLLLQPRNKNFEILADGSLRVGETDRIQGGYEKVGREVTDVPVMLNQIRKELEGGWDGLGYPDHSAALETLLRSKTVLSTQGETTLEKEFERLSDLGVQAYLEYPSSDREGLLQHQAMVRKPFIQVVGERPLDAHLQELARTQGLVAVPNQGSVIFTTESNAPQFLQANAEARRNREEFLETFQKPVEASASSDVTDFLESVRRTHALECIISEETWNSGATLSLPAGTTLRQALDQLKAQGFRWAVREGKLYVLR